MKIDAHQHFWRFDPVRDAWINSEMAVIRRDFLPGDLKPLLDAQGMAGCVAVQADQSETETRFLLDLAAENPFIKGVVGWVDLRAGGLEKRLDQYEGENLLKGFRHILQGEPPDFMLDPAFIKGVRSVGKRGYTYDVLVFPRHLSAVKKFISALGDQPLVIDHLAKPYIRRGLIRQWAKNMKSLARHTNLYCKLSGMVTEAPWGNWQTTDFHPYLETALEAFGPDRLMYGSDWPVCLLSAGYAEQFQIVDAFTNRLSASEKDKIMGLNAAKFYRLNIP